MSADAVRDYTELMETKFKILSYMIYTLLALVIIFSVFIILK